MRQQIAVVLSHLVRGTSLQPAQGTDAGILCSAQHCSTVWGSEARPRMGQGHYQVVTSSPGFGHSAQPHGAHEGMRTRKGRSRPQTGQVTEPPLRYTESAPSLGVVTAHIPTLLWAPPSHQQFGTATECLQSQYRRSLGKAQNGDTQPGHRVPPVCAGPRQAL